VNRVLRRYDLYKRHLPIGPQRTASAETSGGSA
jgi:hypothetical protein